MLHRSSPPGLAPRPRSKRYQPLLVHLSCCFAKLQSESTDRSRFPQFQEGSTCKPLVSGWPDLCNLRQTANSGRPFNWLWSPVSRSARWLLARNRLQSFAIDAPERKYSADKALKRITEESFHFLPLHALDDLRCGVATLAQQAAGARARSLRPAPHCIDAASSKRREPLRILAPRHELQVKSRICARASTAAARAECQTEYFWGVVCTTQRVCLHCNSPAPIQAGCRFVDSIDLSIDLQADDARQQTGRSSSTRITPSQAFAHDHRMTVSTPSQPGRAC